MIIFDTDCLSLLERDNTEIKLYIEQHNRRHQF